jgi:tetratricopeptide (TPR) repeat protein
MRDYGGIADILDDLDLAESAYSRARDLFRELGDEDGLATSIFRLGVVASARGHVEEARRLWTESREIWQRSNDPLGELQVLGFLGALEIRTGDVEPGIEMAERSLAMGQDVGWGQWVSWRRTDVAEGHLKVGRTDAGEQQAREALADAREIGHRAITIFALALLSWAAAQRGDIHRAAILWATILAEEAKEPILRWGRHRDRYAARLPEDLPPADPLPLEEAMEFALRVPD